ncbi:MAG: glycosyltransferase family 2 protein [Phyllobacterium sp.]
MSACTVIIPYYQTELGILNRALKSVLAQTFNDFEILIVDDQSPLPVEQELELLTPQERARVRVLKQPNGGPGGARNTGMDNVGADCAFIAFLDSDDIWMPNHLANARRAIVEFGAECFWDTISADTGFDPYMKFQQIENQGLLARIPSQDDFFQITDMQRALLVNWWHFFHMSSFAAARPIFETARFDEDFRIACEDLLFFFSCAQTARKVVVCEEVGANRGRGDNLYHGTKFGSVKAFRQLYYSILATQRLRKQGNYSGDDYKKIDAWQQETREHAVRNALSGIIRGRFRILPVFFKWVIKDPIFLWTTVEMSCKLMSKRAFRSAWTSP